MSEEIITTQEELIATDNFNRLPTRMRETAAERKYAKAVEMYASTALSIRCVAKKCGVSPSGLSAHIGKHHRDLLFARYGLDINDEKLRSLKIKPPKGQSLMTHLKYKDAIEACGDIAYIEFNVSQVARMFSLDGSALAAQLRVHYPDVIPNREKLRQKLGIADNVQRGARPWCAEAYADALEMYRDSDLSIPQVADRCNVSKSGFCQFLRFYHKDVIEMKSARRREARKKVGVRRPGELAGNGKLYGPKPATVALYAPALDLYRNSSLTVKEIVEKTGVPEAGFKGYLHQWHRGEKLRRRGCEWDGVSDPDLAATRQFLKSTAAKYAPAIESLKGNPRNVTQAAAEFGLNPDVFREYLQTHEPKLAALLGMTRRQNGRRVKRSSSEKYEAAVCEYASSAEPLKSIAQRHGIVYNSLCGYVIRNCPEERERHRLMVEKEKTVAG